MNLYVVLLGLTNFFWLCIAYILWERQMDYRFQLNQWEKTNEKLVDYINSRYLGVQDEQMRAPQAAHDYSEDREAGSRVADEYNGSRYTGS